ncbi:MAG: ROK family glucokinase [Lachnospirales bacterium]
MKKYAFGIDVGGTTVKVGFFDIEVDGTLIDKWEVSTRKDEGGKYILSDVAKTINDKLSEKNINIEEVKGIGIGVPGPVLEESIVNKCVNLGWGVFNVAEESSLIFGIPKENILVSNDASVACLGEMWLGAGRGFRDLVLITLGTGVGGGVVLNGKIVSGAFGASGEIGHMKISHTEDLQCGCGKKGCLEQYASATGIVRKINEKLVNTDTPSILRQEHYLSAKSVFDAAKKGDEISMDIVDEVCEDLALALSYVSCTIDPEIFLIGGGVSKAGDMLTDKIQERYTEHCFHASKETKFKIAELGNDAGMYGAVKMIIDK